MNLLDEVPCAVIVTDDAGRLLDVNAALLSLVGGSRESRIGTSIEDLLPPASRIFLQTHVWPTLLRDGRIQEIHLPVIGLGNARVPVLLNSRLGEHHLGRAYYWSLFVVRDRHRFEAELVEQHNMAEAASRALGESQRFIRGIADAIPGMVAYWDESLHCCFANKAYVEWFGKQPHELIGTTVQAPLPDAAREHAQAVLHGAHRAYDTAESGRIFETHMVPDLGSDGRPRGFFTVSTDITERRQSETELRRTVTLLRSVLEASTQVSIIATEPDGKISIFNRGAEQLLGYSASEVVGRETSLKFHDIEEMRQRAAALTLELGRKVHTGLALIEPETLNQQHECTYIRRDGARIPVAIAVTAMQEDQGALVGYLGVAHDISARIQYESSLRRALQKAQLANQAKSQFLANMSHEIRTPMNAVIGLAYLLERTALNEEQTDTLRKIRLASQSLLAIINDVLDLSKIEASEMQIEQAPFMLDELLDELASLTRSQANAKCVDFNMRLDAALPRVVLGDATRLRQVLNNLLSNAIKFTERGAVQLIARPLRATDGGGTRLRFEVRDSGVGISAEALPRLFAPFVQADTSTTRRFGGTGLGLSIVKQLVTLMGGEVGVTSEPGMGSEFWVELEFPACDEAAMASSLSVSLPPAGPGLTGVLVLVADDSPINLEVARRILELEGAQVWLASNGQEAVDYLLTIPHAVDVVLMDVQMPVLDGHDATRRIRNGLGLRDLPIIALTAGITTGEHERAQSAGMNDVVAKPFDPPALVRCIRKYVRVRENSEPSQTLRAPPPQEWPEIEGIDTRDARARLGGDVALLHSLLQRLLQEFADIGEPCGANEPKMLAGRLHNLKGSAGTLGAKAVQRLAAQAEQACRSGTAQHLDALVKQLAAELAKLRSASATLLQRQAVQEPEPVPLEPMDTAALEELLETLRCFDMAAVDGFKALAPHLRLLLGPTAFGEVRQQIDNLQFDLAGLALQGIEAG